MSRTNPTLNNLCMAKLLAACWSTSGGYIYSGETPIIERIGEAWCGGSHYGDIRQSSRQDDIARNKKKLAEVPTGTRAEIRFDECRGEGVTTWEKVGVCAWQQVDSWYEDRE